MIEPIPAAISPIRMVVIIDDDPAFAETLSAMVRSLGYDASVSTDARSSYWTLVMLTLFSWTF